MIHLQKYGLRVSTYAIVVGGTVSQNTQGQSSSFGTIQALGGGRGGTNNGGSVAQEAVAAVMVQQDSESRLLSTSFQRSLCLTNRLH